MNNFFNFALILIFLVPCIAYSQSQVPEIGSMGEFVDPRDQQSYATIQIGNKTWFRENLKYETALSYCPNDNKKEEDCRLGNFYPYAELNIVCPQGWRVSNKEDWDAYFVLLERAYEVKSANISRIRAKPDRIKSPNDTINWYYRADAIEYFETGEGNPLDLHQIGWVQGKKRVLKVPTTYWVGVNETAVPKSFHMHLNGWGYIAHNHDHHVNAKPSKNRRFMVRCVKDSSN